nr:C-type lectin 37Da-like isoform X2 [Drosophila bipectinata]
MSSKCLTLVILVGVIISLSDAARSKWLIERADKKNWFDAFQTCRFKGMHLLYFKTIAEWRELDLYLWDNDWDGVYWTSGNDLAFWKKFYWFSTGKIITMNLWEHGEPNNQGGKEHCVEMGHKRT